MALKRTKVKLRQPSQQEDRKSAKSPQFEHRVRALQKVRRTFT